MASELTLRDMARIERDWADSFADPTLDIPAEDEDPEPNTRKRRLRAALVVCRDKMPRWDNDTGRTMLATAEGIATLLRYSIGGNHDELTLEDFDVMASEITATEFARFEKAAFNSDPMDEIVEAADPKQSTEDSEPTNWEEILSALVKQYGFKPKEVGDLTISELTMILGDGKPNHRPVFTDMASLLAYHEEQKRIWFDDEELKAKEIQ